MPAPCWLHRVELLAGPGEQLQLSEVLIDAQGRLEFWGEGVAARAEALGLPAIDARGWLLAPTLVDPHSVLERPWALTQENLGSLAASAAAGGFGSVAILPWATPWRDRPERMQGLHWPEPLQLHRWGSFCLDGSDTDLAQHHAQIHDGAIGLAGGENLPPLPLLERGLLLGEMGDRPVLLAPRRADLTMGGFVREGVEALRVGWPLDPVVSETLPLQSVLTLIRGRAVPRLALMNLSTASAVEALRSARRTGVADGPPAVLPQASVSWWHLVADSGNLAPSEEGWRLVPSIGTPGDREALIEGMREGLITAVAVHHIPLDPEEQLLPLDQRRPGIAGHGPAHGLVLPLLWQELVHQRGWSVDQLWQALCWGPSALLGLPPERLTEGSRRWLLFDPHSTWRTTSEPSLSLAANLPLQGQVIQGQIRASGLTAPDRWSLVATATQPD